MGEIVPLRRHRELDDSARTENLRRLDEPAEPLWRELVGRAVRRERHDRGERLVDVAERAGVSPQYLSEVERGLKDPSSEMLAAVAGSLGLTVRQLTVRASRHVPGPMLLAA
jgi:hypothetical protein